MSLTIQNMLKVTYLAATAGALATCAYANSNKDAFNRVEHADWIARSLIEKAFWVFKRGLEITACIKACQIGSSFLSPITFIPSVIVASTTAYLAMKKCMAVANRYPPLSPNINLIPPRDPEAPDLFKLRKEKLEQAMAHVFNISDQTHLTVRNFILGNLDHLLPENIASMPNLRDIIGNTWEDQGINHLIEARTRTAEFLFYLALMEAQNPYTLDFQQPENYPEDIQTVMTSINTVNTVIEEILEANAAAYQDQARFDMNWAVKPWQLQLQTLLALNIVGTLVAKIAQSTFFGPFGYLELAGLFFAFCAISRPKFIEFRKGLTLHEPNEEVPYLKEIDLRAYFPACFAKVPEGTTCAVCLDDLSPETMSSSAVIAFGCEGKHLFHAQCIAPHVREATSQMNNWQIRCEFKEPYTEYRNQFRTARERIVHEPYVMPGTREIVYRAELHTEFVYEKTRVYGPIADIKYIMTLDPSKFPNCPCCREGLKNLTFQARVTEEITAFSHTARVNMPAEILLAAP